MKYDYLRFRFVALNEDFELALSILADIIQNSTFAEFEKEKAQFKAVLGEALRKEAYAKNFNAAEGTVAVRENLSIINTASEILAEEIYSLVANIFKIKLDETHRAVDALKSVLMSRMQEAKMASVDGFVGDN